jgi:ribose transport system permease protein
MGSDERAAYTSGVPITAVRIGAHLISGAFAGLAAICFTALISSGDPSQGTTYTLIAVTALVLGGASLGGGRGGVFGSFLGAVNLYLITFVLSTFNFGAVQSFVTNLAYGSILVASLLLTLAIPFIQRHIRNFSPLLYFVGLGVLTLGIVLHATYDAAPRQNTRQAAPAAAVAVAAPAGPLQPIPPEKLYVAPLEVAAATPEEAALAREASPYVLGATLIVALALLLRLAFAAAGRRQIAPAVALVVAALVLLAAYGLSRPAAPAAPPTQETGP